MVIIPDIHKKAMATTRKEFENLIEPFKVKDKEDTSKSKYICTTNLEIPIHKPEKGLGVGCGVDNPTPKKLRVRETRNVASEKV